ncbi:hypothetical protein [Agromyces neolithicus]|uniref:Sortase n=1 Tax=Agromyces neolithicus TaxID=269420 RepID=A0ABP4YA88_9MICO
MGAAEIISVVSEVIGWIALGVGLVCLLLALLIRIADGRWVRTDAVVVDYDEHSVIRWFAEGAFHSRILGSDEREHVTSPDEEPAYYKQRDPDRLRLHEPPAGRRVIRNVGLVMIGIAALAALIGLAMLLFE